MDWETFSRKVKACQRGFMGEPDEMRPGRGEFHEYPHDCVCEKPPEAIQKSNDEENLEQVAVVLASKRETTHERKRVKVR